MTRAGLKLLQVWLPLDVHAALEREARAHVQSKTSVVRQILTAQLRPRRIVERAAEVLIRGNVRRKVKR